MLLCDWYDQVGSRALILQNIALWREVVSDEIQSNQYSIITVSSDSLSVQYRHHYLYSLSVLLFSFYKLFALSVSVSHTLLPHCGFTGGKTHSLISFISSVMLLSVISVLYDSAICR